MAVDNEITQVKAMAPPPAILGDVRLGELVDGGLSSEVFAGENLLASKRCAVKIVRRELDVGSVARGRYMHEAKRIASMGLDVIADVYSFGVTPDGRTYAVQQWLEGHSLRSMVRGQVPWPRRTYLPVMRAICAALAQAHAHGFPHRRIHGGNIMVTAWAEGSAPQVKLLDFGIWRLHPAMDDGSVIERSAEQAICIAPEIAKGQDGDARSDVYSLAVLLYEMVTGSVPFLGKDFASTLEQQLSATPRLPREMVALPPELEQTILGGLEKDPRKRIPSVEALLSALDPLWSTGKHQVLPKGRLRQLTTDEHRLDGLAPPAAQKRVSSEISAVKPALDGPLQPPKKKPWLLVILVLTVLVCGGALAFFLVFDNDEPAPIKKTPRIKRRARPARQVKPRVKTILRPAKKALPTVGEPKAAPPKAAPPSTPPSPAPAVAPAASEVVPPKKAKPRGVMKLGTATAVGGQGMIPIDRLRLTARASQATLTLVSGSPDTRFFLDGKYVGVGLRKVIRGVSAGKHRVHAQRGGKDTPARDIDLKPKQNKTLAF